MLRSHACIAAPVGFRFTARIPSGMRLAMNQSPPIADVARAELVQLLGRIESADQPALRALYDRTSAKLYGICLRVLGNEADAQDVLQDVYVTVWRKAAQYDAAKAGPITWLATLARNRAIDRVRSRRAPTVDLEKANDIADEGQSALDVIEQAEDSTRLAACLDELEERARLVIKSAFFDGKTYVELAERESVPLGTMKSWIRRGLLRLRGCLER